MHRPESTRREFLSLAAVATAAATPGCASHAVPVSPPRHVVLLGDSIFDNAAYVRGKPCVIEQLTAALAGNGRATLLARDGDRAADVAGQSSGLPDDATHLVVSVGGNDALDHAGLLRRPIESSAELLGELARIQAAFRATYAAMLDAVRARRLPTAVCTIYDSNFEAPRKTLADVALAVWNDVILRCASEVGVPVLDLRRIFRAPSDYANAIEPSDLGGAKLAAALVELVTTHGFTTPRTTLYP